VTFEKKLDASSLPALFKAVVAVLYEHSPKIYPKQQTVADYCGCKRAAVSRILGAAEELGVIRRIKDPRIGRGKYGPMTRYRIDTEHSLWDGVGVDDALAVIRRHQKGWKVGATQEINISGVTQETKTPETTGNNSLAAKPPEQIISKSETDTGGAPKRAQRAQGHPSLAASLRNGSGWDFDETLEVMDGTGGCAAGPGSAAAR
jgi:hypothetical protein